jgi:hypothetical protein
MIAATEILIIRFLTVRECATFRKLIRKDLRSGHCLQSTGARQLNVGSRAGGVTRQRTGERVESR